MGTLATEIRDRLGPCPELVEYPLVSIVVLNRDGVEHLRRLLRGLTERTDYSRLELILVDNGSSDGSLEFIRAVEAPFPISIVANRHNESFSDANNQGAELASGDLLLFMNNDVEPFEPGWLRELVACLDETQAGTVGATLIYPEETGDTNTGYHVQTQPERIRGSLDSLGTDDDRTPRSLFDEGFGEDVDAMYAIGACILLKRENFQRIGGFTHGYFYGGEDLDLAFKLRELGLRILYSGRSILRHHVSSTSRKLFGETGGAVRFANALLLRSRWGARVRREYELDRLAGGGLWAVPGQDDLADAPPLEEVLALGFCLRAGQAEAEAASLKDLELELAQRGHRCLVLDGDSTNDPRAFLYDVVVYLRGPNRYLPVPAQLNVLWVVSHFDALTGIECNRYDLVVTTNAAEAAQLREEGQHTPVIALDGATPAAGLIDAVLARAEQIDFPTRLDLQLQPAASIGTGKARH